MVPDVWTLLRWSRERDRWEETHFGTATRQTMEELVHVAQQDHVDERWCAVPKTGVTNGISVWDYQGDGQCWERECKTHVCFEAELPFHRFALICHLHLTRFLRDHTSVRYRT